MSVLHEIERYYTDLSKGTRIRVEKWVQKLAMTGHNITWKRHRNAYAKLLLHMVLNRQLEAPFNSLPPEGSLSSFPVHLKAYTVRGAYNGSGGFMSVGTEREAMNLWSSEPGCGTGSANFVANTIIRRHGCPESSTTSSRRYVSNRYIPTSTGGETHANVFWRDVYARVMESPMGEDIISEGLVPTSHADDGCDVIINHMHYTPEPPPPPPLPPVYALHGTGTKANQTTSAERVTDVHQHARPQHAHNAQSSTVKRNHLHSETDTQNQEAVTSSHKHESTAEHKAASTDDTHSRLPPPAVQGPETRFHYASDSDGKRLMCDETLQVREIRRLALLVREQQRNYDALHAEMLSEREAHVKRLQKQAEEHVKELRAVLTTTCRKCNLLLAGEDEDDSIELEPSKTEHAVHVNHLQRARSPCAQSSSHSQGSSKPLLHAPQQAATKATRLDGRKVTFASNLTKDSHLIDLNGQHRPSQQSSSASTKSECEDVGDQGVAEGLLLGMDSDMNTDTFARVDSRPLAGAMWQYRGISVATDTNEDTLPAGGVVGNDRVSRAWQVLLEMGKENNIFTEPKLHNNSRYADSAYWTDEHTPAHERPCHLTTAATAAVQAQASLPSNSDPICANKPSAAMIPQPQPISSVLQPAQLRNVIAPALVKPKDVVTRKSNIGGEPASEAFMFLERQLSRCHFEFGPGQAGSNFPPTKSHYK